MAQVIKNNGKKVTVANVCRTLILQGKTDAQVERTLKRKFGMDDDKAHYNTSWYRSECKRKGLTLESLKH